MVEGGKWGGVGFEDFTRFGGVNCSPKFGPKVWTGGGRLNLSGLVFSIDVRRCYFE